MGFIIAHGVGLAAADLFGIAVSGSGEQDADEFAAFPLAAAGSRGPGVWLQQRGMARARGAEAKR